MLDSETVSKMMTPRCGVADIVNGRSRMRSKNHYSHGGNSNSIHTVSHYSFFQGNPKWPSPSTHLTYGFLPSTPSNAMNPVSRAFEKWASATQFTFSLAQNPQNANLVIDESWSVGPVPGAYDLETVALHEIGHLLGLGHSSVQDAIMFPGIPPGVSKNLHADDIEGIKALYNV
ncbi:Matrixin family protein [Abeliophyllum distichum]|uniref:Matrixin family protein n=1 Tax=Abeliophyllum distichum TaxID=126358 RepID=A0ABD1SXD2_9LAMI